MYLGIKIDNNYWDSENQGVLNIHPQALLLNSYLGSIRKMIDQLFISPYGGIDSFDPVKLRSRLKALKPVPWIGFFDAFLAFMEESHERWTKNTYLKVRSLYFLLRAYDEQAVKKLQVYSVEKQDFIEISDYFINKKKFAGTTSYKYLNILKWFLSWASGKNYCSVINLKELKPSEVSEVIPNTEIIYLLRDEILQLYNMEGLHKPEDRIRDIFCFLCFTGIRYSELKRLKKQDVSQDILRYNNSGSSRDIPLNGYAREILKKYQNIFFRNDSLFPVFSEITINKYLRSIAIKGDMNRIVQVREKFGEQKKDFRLNRVITIGIARNTFIMNGLLLGVSEESIIRLTGGKSDFLLKRYKAQIEQKDKVEAGKFDLLRKGIT